LWTFGQLSPLSLLFLSVFLSVCLSLPPKKREKWATPITQKHTYKEEGVMSSTLKKKTPINTNIQRRRRSDELHFEKKTPINTNIQRRRRSDEHQFATKKNKKTHP
jgi:hypothetical protein